MPSVETRSSQGELTKGLGNRFKNMKKAAKKKAPKRTAPNKGKKAYQVYE